MSEQLSSNPRCACVHHDAHTCYVHRYAPMDDLQRAEFLSLMEAEGDGCECPCHENSYDEWEGDES
jgi:hypothetical protein